MKIERVVNGFLRKVRRELWCVDRKTRRSANDELRKQIMERASSLSAEKGLASSDEAVLREAVDGLGSATSTARRFSMSFQRRFGAVIWAYLMFLALIALFSVVNGFGTASMNIDNIVQHPLPSDDPEFVKELSIAAVHTLRLAMGVLLLSLLMVALKRPRRVDIISSTYFLGIAVVVTVFDSIELASMTVHRTVYASEALFEWAANYAFAPWVILSCLLVVFLGHVQMQKYANLWAD